MAELKSKSTTRGPVRSAAKLVRSVWRRLKGPHGDYRAVLFEELKKQLGGRPAQRILEIGPRDCLDTARLLSLGPELVTLIELPHKREQVEGLLRKLEAPATELFIGNLMYDPRIDDMMPYDVVWCTGVLYHNPEQLRMVRKLYDLVVPGGFLVLESSTARRYWWMRNQNFVEIWYPPDEGESEKRHVSTNITHLPSWRAVESWLIMVGFEKPLKSLCHRAVSRALARQRAAFVARKPLEESRAAYYNVEEIPYLVGKAR